MNSPTLQEFLKEIEDSPEYLGVPFAGVHTRNVLGDTPLHIAAIRGDVHIIGLLLDAGAEIDAPGEHGYTPLHEAVEQGQVEAVRFLLSYGASPGVPNKWGATPKGKAALSGVPEIQELFHE